MHKCFNTVDLFCGAGGASTGIDLALREAGLTHSGIAINHWKVAVDTMHKNHPELETMQMSIEEAVPADLVPGGEVDLMWASPSCTHHSRAKGGRPRSNQLRAQPELILTWLDQLFVRNLIVENVPEFVNWGPLSKTGKPIRSQEGACFRAWVESLKARNYQVDWRVVNCADYGDATTRKRFFLKAVRKGCGKIRWPEPTYSEEGGRDLFGEKKRWRGIRECLDFSDLGRSIFGRKKQLSENTLRRIRVGLEKFCGSSFQMDMLFAKGPDGNRLHGIDEPIPTQHAQGGRTAVVVPFVVKANRGQDVEDVNSPISTVTVGGGHHWLCAPLILDHFRNGEMQSGESPIGAQTTHDRFSMVSPIIVDMSHPGNADDAGRVEESACPVRTITTRNNLAVVTPFVITEQTGNAPRSIDEPLRAQTTVRKDFIVSPMVLGQQSGSAARPVDSPSPTIATAGAIRLLSPIAHGERIIDIRMRMLKPSELAAAHSFPSDYVLTGTKTEQVKQIGNSVPVMTAKAMVLTSLPA